MTPTGSRVLLAPIRSPSTSRTWQSMRIVSSCAPIEISTHSRQPSGQLAKAGITAGVVEFPHASPRAKTPPCDSLMLRKALIRRRCIRLEWLAIVWSNVSSVRQLSALMRLTPASNTYTSLSCHSLASKLSKRPKYISVKATSTTKNRITPSRRIKSSRVGKVWSSMVQSRIC